MPDSHFRRDEREALVNLLLSGKSVLMLAPRRIGKTWLMDRVKEDLEAGDIRVIKVEVAGLGTEQEFLNELCKGIDKAKDIKAQVWTQFLQRIRQAAGNNEAGTLAQAVGRLDPRQFLETLVEELNKDGATTVVMIDEIALFVQELAKRDPDAARRLLYQIRKLWQGCKNVVWFLTGSIGLDEIGRRHDMAGALLGIEPFSLQPFSARQAHSFFLELKGRSLVRDFEFAEGGFDYLTAELGWLSPYHLEHVFKLIEPTSGKATKEDVEASFAKMLSSGFRLHFAGWDEHIDKNFPPDEAADMHLLLAIAAQHADGEMEATFLARLRAGTPRRKLTNLLTSLSNNAYLIKDGERWRFRSGLLRRYWLEYVA